MNILKKLRQKKEAKDMEAIQMEAIQMDPCDIEALKISKFILDKFNSCGELIHYEYLVSLLTLLHIVASIKLGILVFNEKITIKDNLRPHIQSVYEYFLNERRKVINEGMSDYPDPNFYKNFNGYLHNFCELYMSITPYALALFLKSDDVIKFIKLVNENNFFDKIDGDSLIDRHYDLKMSLCNKINALHNSTISSNFYGLI